MTENNQTGPESETAEAQPPPMPRVMAQMFGLPVPCNCERCRVERLPLRVDVALTVLEIFSHPRVEQHGGEVSAEPWEQRTRTDARTLIDHADAIKPLIAAAAKRVTAFLAEDDRC